MKLRGSEAQVGRDEYARLVAERVQLDVLRALDAGPTEEVPPPEQVADRIGDLLLGLGEERNEIADLLAPFWSAEKTRASLGSPSRSALADRRKAGTVLGLKTTDGMIVYPVAQFERHAGQVRVRPGLRPFLMTLKRRSPWTVALLMHTPAAELGGVTPLDWVRQNGDPEPLRGYADRVDAEWSR